MRDTLPNALAFAYGANLKVGNAKESMVGRMVNLDSEEDEPEVANNDYQAGGEGEDGKLIKSQQIPDDSSVV